MQDSNFKILFYLLMFAIVLGVIGGYRSVGNYFSSRRVKKLREKEFKSNIEIDSLGEPHAIRDLDPAEKMTLREKHKAISFWTNISHYTLPINIAIILVAAYFGVYRGYFKSDDYIDLFSYTFVPLIIQLGLISLEGKTYKDMRAPVFAVSGGLLKVIKKRKRFEEKIFVVRGINFSSDENRDVTYYWDKWKEGDNVQVVYSPFTKHIWRINKI